MSEHPLSGGSGFLSSSPSHRSDLFRSASHKTPSFLSYSRSEPSDPSTSAPAAGSAPPGESAGSSDSEGGDGSKKRSRRRGSRRSRRGRGGTNGGSDSSDAPESAGSTGRAEASAGPAGGHSEAPAGPRSSERRSLAPVSRGGGESSEEGEGRAPRRRRGGRRRGRPSTGEAGEDAGASSAREAAPEAAAREPRDSREASDTARSSSDGTAEDANSGSGESVDRKRRTRRVRSRRSAKAGSSIVGAGEASRGADAKELEGSADAGGKRSRKRGSRGGRGRGKKVQAAVGIDAIPGEDDDLPELMELPDDAVLVGSAPAASRGKRGSKKKRPRRSRASEDDEDLDDDEDTSPPVPPKKRIILVNAGDPEETRVAVVEDGRIADLQMTVKKYVSYVNDIYRGRIVNIESAIGAAFVDFGQGRNGFMHVSDILPSYGDPDWSLENLLSSPGEHQGVDENEEDGDEEIEGEGESEAPEKAHDKPQGGRRRSSASQSRSKRVRVPIDKLIKKGQMVAVQITKDAIGDKGPTLSTFVSIPGRYLVLMPSLERTGVSRKIDDEKERRRLKRILTSLEIPEGMGVIVRTAGIGKTKAELKRDLDYLLLAWDDFSRRLKSGRNPAPLYQESDVAIRTMRDLFTAETSKVIVDDEVVYQRMVEFTERLMPEHVERIVRHEGPRPLLQTHGVEQDFEKIFSRRVELPSGGSIVLDQTEALVAVDVNSGRTREAGAEFEDIALKTNLEAVPEIARQIRLRDLGGIIVLDFIDMMKANSRRAVERAVRDAMKTDRARSKLGRISQFGLLELTRQRLGPGLNKLVYDTCIRCRGSGRRRNASSRAQAILRRLGASLALKGFTSVEVRAHNDVIEYLQNELKGELERLEEISGRSMLLTDAPEQVEDSVLHYLRADGREVRPGGRRRR